MSDLFVFAGEPSGDMHGSHLIKMLLKQIPQLKISGVGGPQMRLHNMDLLLPMEAFEVMGFTDVLFALPKLFRQFKQVKEHILETQPKALVLIDYPGFNLRLARAVRKSGYKGKIIQYISPTVWAHGKQRIQLMANQLDLLLTIYPFEAAYYAATTLKVVYIGNPLKEYVQRHPYDREWPKQFEGRQMLSVFPGSRKGEIERNLPQLLETASQLKNEDSNAIIAISCAHEETFNLVQQLIEKTDLKLNVDTFLIPKRYTYEMMRRSRAALAKSGTVTLELALHRCPTVVVYQLTPLNRFIAKWILRLKLPFYCIVNILVNKKVFPELIEKQFSYQDIWKELKKLWKDGESRDHSLAGCEQAIALLEKRDASQEAATAIKGLMQS